MAEPRATVVTIPDRNGLPNEVEIYLNPEARDQLIRELQGLNEKSDHVHYGTWEGAEVSLQDIAYSPRQVIVDHLKIYFRLDAWDQQYFPHVIPSKK